MYTEKTGISRNIYAMRKWFIIPIVSLYIQQQTVWLIQKHKKKESIVLVEQFKLNGFCMAFVYGH